MSALSAPEDPATEGSRQRTGSRSCGQTYNVVYLERYWSCVLGPGKYSAGHLNADGKHPALSERRGVSELPLGPQEEGQGLVEYALVLVLIAIVVIAVILLVWPALAEILNDAGIAIPDQLKSLF